MPGLGLRLDQLPMHVQTLDAQAIRRAGASGLPELLNSQLQSVNVNDHAGNPLQMDVSYRGFTASPQVGTAQGLSVFFDGIRINEPFGDIVNWDMLPLNAIERLDLFPGANAIYGQNTLGGSIALQSRSGFSAPGVEVGVVTGQHGRREFQLAAGAHGSSSAAFGALSTYNDGGWRDDSPSRAVRGLGRIDVRGQGVWSAWEGGATVVVADNTLVGNGLLPIDLWRHRPQAAFTSPDRSANRIGQLALHASWRSEGGHTLTARLHRRHTARDGLNGDMLEAFDEMYGDDHRIRGPRVNLSGKPVCQFLDVDRNGQRDTLRVPDPQHPGQFIEFVKPALNGGADGQSCGFLVEDPATVDLGKGRNGGRLQGGVSNGSGVIEGTPIGLLTRTRTRQRTDGLNLLWAGQTGHHRWAAGALMEHTLSTYRNDQQLGNMDARRRVVADPQGIDRVYRAAQTSIPVNVFGGSSDTRALFLQDTWTPRAGLDLTLGARYTRTAVQTRVQARLGEDIVDLLNRELPYVLCGSTDPASCADAPQFVVNNLATETRDDTRERHVYHAFNPALGFSWQLSDHANLFANLSRGSRAPSVIELGCAFDRTPVQITTFDPVTGLPVQRTVPRATVAPPCALPSTLSGDPYLPQIRATALELGLRGRLAPDWHWNAALYRTDLRNDLYLVGGGATNYFDSIGRTRHQGLELGLRGQAGPLDLQLNYAYTDATFQSTFYIASPHNSSADFDVDSLPSSASPSPTAGANGGLGTFQMIRVDPGAHLPGMAVHNLNAEVRWHASPKLELTLGMVGHGRSFMRLNENNAHQPQGTDGVYGSVSGFGGYNGDVQGRPFREKGSVPAYAVFRLEAAWQPAPGWRLVGRVDNLFDRGYFSAGRLGITPFASGTLGAIGISGWNYNSTEWRNTSFVAPGAPRSLQLALEVSL